MDMRALRILSLLAEMPAFVHFPDDTLLLPDADGAAAKGTFASNHQVSGL